MALSDLPLSEADISVENKLWSRRQDNPGGAGGQLPNRLFLACLHLSRGQGRAVARVETAWPARESCPAFFRPHLPMC